MVNTLKQSVGKLLANCLSVFDNFVRLVLKGLTHFEARLTFYAILKTYICGFLMFSGGVEKDHWPEMG